MIPTSRDEISWRYGGTCVALHKEGEVVPFFLEGADDMDTIYGSTHDEPVNNIRADDIEWGFPPLGYRKVGRNIDFIYRELRRSYKRGLDVNNVYRIRSTGSSGGAGDRRSLEAIFNPGAVATGRQLNNGNGIISNDLALITLNQYEYPVLFYKGTPVGYRKDGVFLIPDTHDFAHFELVLLDHKSEIIDARR